MDAPHPSMIYGGRGPVIMGITWCETAIALAMVAARLWGASIRRGELRWDFVWVAVACACGLTSQSLLTVSVAHGLGMHLWELDLDLIATVLKYYWASSAVGLIGILAAKVAIIALLLAVRGPNQKKRGYFLHFLWISNAAFIIVLNILLFKSCNPTSAIWNIAELAHAECKNRRVASNFSFAQGAWSACTDIALALYPISVVWSLQTSLKMKIGFCVLMGGGIIAAVSVAIRTYYSQALVGSVDVTYTFADFMIWGGTELWLVIILGSIPPLRPLFAKLFGRARNLSSYGSARGYGNGTGQQLTVGGGTKKSGLMSPGRGTFDESTRPRGLISVLATDNGSAEEVLPEKQVVDMGGITVKQTFEVVETHTRDEVRDLEKGGDNA